MYKKNEVLNDIRLMTSKLNEYRNVYRLNPYSAVKMMPELRELNEFMKSKYEISVERIDYSISNDNYESELRTTLSNVIKISDQGQNLQLCETVNGKIGFKLNY